jgi:ethanolamine utilization protein EutP (predicted NTPase)
MDDSSTAQATGTTVADAAERIASLLGPADSEVDETREDQTSGAEDDGEEPDPEADPNADPEESEEDPQPVQTFKVKVQGEELEVPLDELLKGYSREADYTRKTQALKEAQRGLADTQARYLDQIELLEQALSAADQPVDQTLREKNPDEWSRQMANKRQLAALREQVNAERTRRDEARSQQAAEAKAETMQRLLIEIPEWNDPEVLKAEDNRLGAYAAGLGLSEEERMNVAADWRTVAVLRKAMLYDELKARTPAVKAKVEAVKTAKPGTAPVSNSKATELNRAKQRLRQTGRLDDAAVAIERILG